MTLRWHSALAWLGSALVLATFVRLPNVDGWDEAFYVGQLVSLIGDGDLVLQDDVVNVAQRPAEKLRIVTTVDRSGALLNTMSLGPAVLLSPFTYPVISRAQPPPWRSFRILAALAAMTLLLLTALCTVDVLTRLGIGPGRSWLALFLVFVAGPLSVYGTRSYLGSHLGSAFLIAVTLRQAVALSETTGVLPALGLGLAAGLATLDRWQDVVIAGPLVVAALMASRRSSPAAWVLAGVGAALPVACQLRAWQLQFGSALLVPQGSGYMDWLLPHTAALLLSTHNGLLAWAPGLALGLLCLPLAWRRSPARWLGPTLAAVTLVALYVSSCPEDWWGRDSFGPRRLTSLTPVAAVGMGLLLQRASRLSAALLAAGLSAAGVALASAHFSGHSDLMLLVLGRPDPFGPALAAPPSPRWMDSWGPWHFAKPAFSLSDTPHDLDRIVGVAIVSAVVLIVFAAWTLLQRSRFARGTALGLTTALVVAWLVLLARAPSNDAANAAWKRFLEDPRSPERAAALPPDCAVARDLVLREDAALDRPLRQP